MPGCGATTWALRLLIKPRPMMQYDTVVYQLVLALES